MTQSLRQAMCLTRAENPNGGIHLTAKEILTSCRAAVLELHKLDDQLARCLPTGRPSGVKAQQYDALPPGTNEPTAAAIQLYEGLKAQEQEKAAEVARLTKKVWPIIMAAHTPRAMVILNNYYILGMSDQEIARQQRLSREHICRERHEALKNLR